MMIDNSMLKNKVLELTLYYRIERLTVNLRSINNSEFRIYFCCSGKLTVIVVPTFSSLSSFISAPW